MGLEFNHITCQKSDSYQPRAAGRAHHMLSESGGFSNLSTTFFSPFLQTKKHVQELEWLTTVAVWVMQNWECTKAS